MKRTDRRKREFEAGRGEILAAAETIFAAKGFHGAAMSEIAAAAGFAVGSLYRFFTGKEELYTAMVSEKLDGFYSHLEESVRRSDTVHGRIEILIRETFRFVEGNATFCMMLMRREGLALPEGNRILQERMVASYHRQISLVAGILEEGIRAGEMKPCDTRAVAVALKGLVHGFIFDWMLTRGRPLSRRVDTALELFTRGVEEAPAARDRNPAPARERKRTVLPGAEAEKIRGNP
ncbi:MAG: TetR/AcrR family transcriptional regulator [Syntrophales bacterium]|jgi:AcrR family transcriptional regulator|nr:TetR/AcrR family transcriptional regulator [Syntrophales bacterium]